MTKLGKLDKTFRSDNTLYAQELNLLVTKINDIIDYINANEDIWINDTQSQNNQGGNGNQGENETPNYYTTCEIKRTGPTVVTVTITLGDSLFELLNGRKARIIIKGTSNMYISTDDTSGWTIDTSRLYNITSKTFDIEFNRASERRRYCFVVENSTNSSISGTTNDIVVGEPGMDVVTDDPVVLPTE